MYIQTGMGIVVLFTSAEKKQHTEILRGSFFIHSAQELTHILNMIPTRMYTEEEFLYIFLVDRFQ